MAEAAATAAAAKERKILVAVDEGEESSYALSWCLKNVVSENSKDTLVLLYAKPPRAVYTTLDGTGYLFSTDVMATTMERHSNEVADSVLEKAKRLCKDLKDGISWECEQSLCTEHQVSCFDSEEAQSYYFWQQLISPFLSSLLLWCI